MKKLHLLTMVTLALLAASSASLAQNSSAWTTACSSGATIQKVDLSLYSVIANYLTLQPGATGNVVARYNVTNTSVPSVPAPPWNTMELSYFDNAGGSSVTATLYQYEPCENVLTIICPLLTSVDNAAVTCVQCQFPIGSFDFTRFVYFVEVTVTRNAANQVVRAHSLRIYQM